MFFAAGANESKKDESYNEEEITLFQIECDGGGLTGGEDFLIEPNTSAIDISTTGITNNFDAVFEQNLQVGLLDISNINEDLPVVIHNEEAATNSCEHLIHTQPEQPEPETFVVSTCPTLEDAVNDYLKKKKNNT